MRAQRPDDILCELWLVRVPDEADGDDLRGVHENLPVPHPLSTGVLDKTQNTATIYRKTSTIWSTVIKRNFKVLGNSKENVSNKWGYYTLIVNKRFLHWSVCYTSLCQGEWTMYFWLTRHLRRSPIILAACNSSPNDLRLWWPICWLLKKGHIVQMTEKEERKKKYKKLSTAKCQLKRTGKAMGLW